MNTSHFVNSVHFPSAWHKHGLLEAGFVVQQATEFEREYGARQPTGGTEHWRHGTFLYWLRSEPSAEQLAQLLEAALHDPDPPMAGGVIKQILGSPLSTITMLEAAIQKVASSRAYYVTGEELKAAFSSRP